MYTGEGTYWPKILSYIKAPTDPDYAVFKARVLLDDAWQSFCLSMLEYLDFVYPVVDDEAMQLLREQPYLNRIAVSADLVLTRWEQLRKIEHDGGIRYAKS